MRLTSLAGLILVFVTVLISNICVPGVDAKTLKEIPTDTQIIQEMGKGKIKSTVTKEDEKLVELKHWKYGQKNKSTARNAENQTAGGRPALQNNPSAYAEGSQTLSIYFPSEDDIKILTAGLIKLGYLKKPTSNQEEFMEALSSFQHDYKIKSLCDIKLTTFDKLQPRKK